jgi:hypothetical protein
MEKLSIKSLYVWGLIRIFKDVPNKLIWTNQDRKFFSFEYYQLA